MTTWLFLVAHFLADFSLQSAKLAEKKTQKLRYLLAHALIYAAVMAAAAYSTNPVQAIWLPWLVVSLSHLGIDWLRVLLDRKIKVPGFHFASFLADQALHVGIILACTYQLDLQYNWLSCLPLSVSADQLLRYVLLVVVILDPASVFVKKLSAYVSPDTTEVKSSHVGTVIGKLERILVAVLVLCEEIGAIGFVLTAKSLARYSQLNDRDFAEKYLVGTLASTAFAIAAALLLR